MFYIPVCDGFGATQITLLLQLQHFQPSQECKGLAAKSTGCVHFFSFLYTF